MFSLYFIRVIKEKGGFFMPINIKRAYDEYDKADGMRILVDRMWPRGISKAEAHLDEWEKEVAPSEELRKWFDHDPEKYKSFKEKYKQEMKDNKLQKESLNKLKKWTKQHEKNITLIYGAKDEKYNHAKVLKEILDHQ